MKPQFLYCFKEVLIHPTEDLTSGSLLLYEYSNEHYKYKMVTYKKGYFRGGSNINLNLITCEDKIVIL